MQGSKSSQEETEKEKISEEWKSQKGNSWQQIFLIANASLSVLNRMRKRCLNTWMQLKERKVTMMGEITIWISKHQMTNECHYFLGQS